MHRLLALWRSRLKLAAYAIFKHRPIAGASGEGEGDEGEGSGEAGSGGESGGKTFTQADLDRIVQDRLARQAKQYEGFDDLKQKAQRLDEIEAASASDLEKAQKRAEKAEASAQAAIDRANKQLIQAAILSAATQAKAIKPEHLHKLIDTESVTVADDGQVTGAQDAVTAFLKANPEYVGNGQPKGDADQGARKSPPNQLSREALASMTPAEIETARKDGRLDNLLKGA